MTEQAETPSEFVLRQVAQKIVGNGEEAMQDPPVAAVEEAMSRADIDYDAKSRTERDKCYNATRRELAAMLSEVSDG